MKALMIVLGAVLALGLLVFGLSKFGSSANTAGSQTDDPNAPKVELTEKKYDFRKIGLNDIAKHEFKLKNVGQKNLIINNLMTSCHCTTAVFKLVGKPDSPEFGMHQDSNWQGEIPSGSEAAIEVIYSPAKMPVKGQVSRVITFTTNDPNNKTVQLEIIAEVQ